MAVFKEDSRFSLHSAFAANAYLDSCPTLAAPDASPLAPGVEQGVSCESSKAATSVILIAQLADDECISVTLLGQ